ncbi:MAG: RluA family pseudouridine synthase [Planctomycetes bacterium]|nr:RluA family pseudouridine synthase [Planctomycetota bacterium]
MTVVFSREVAYSVDPVENGLRLDAFLTRKMRWRSRTSIQSLVKDEQVSLVRRGERTVPTRVAITVLTGDVLSVTLPKPKRDVEYESGTRSTDATLKKLYEDRFFVAVDKPPDVAVHPAGRNLYRTVIGELHKAYRKFDDPERDIVPKLCHRLDLETSGVLLVAKDDAAHRAVSEMFRERETEKDYLAIVYGVPAARRGIIDAPIGEAVGSAVGLKRAVREDGQPARTGYEVIATVPGFALVKIQLFTGRHHQIRVHLASIGHPIVGDKIYGPDEEIFIRYQEDRLTEDDRARLLLPRQALHAHRLKIRHPMKDGFLEITSELPDDLKEFLESRG